MKDSLKSLSPVPSLINPSFGCFSAFANPHLIPYWAENFDSGEATYFDRVTKGAAMMAAPLVGS